MHLLCVGISHRTAPVEVREQLAFSAERVTAGLADLREQYPHSELAILSTCNRTEVYVARPLHGYPRVEQVVAWLAERSGASGEQLAEGLYHYDNERAIRHLFRVAAGLDSMVVGEGQIAGQVKQAYELAQQAETVGKALHRVFQLALATGKRVRNQTGVGEGRFSVAGVSVAFAGQLFETLAGRSVLVIGAGETAGLIVRHLLPMGPREVVICNRSAERAAALQAKIEGESAGGGTRVRTIDSDGMYSAVVDADVVIASTGSDEPVLTAAGCRRLVRDRGFRPLFVVDLGVPRDVDPALADFANVFLFDMDDLQQAASENVELRQGAAEEAEQLVERAVGECYLLVQTGDASDLIRRLRRRLHKLGHAEAARTGRKLAAALDVNPDEEARMEALLEEMSHRLINKVLHKPVREFNQGGAPAALYATALRRLFDLGDEEDLAAPERTGPQAQRRDLPGE